MSHTRTETLALAAARLMVPQTNAQIAALDALDRHCPGWREVKRVGRPRKPAKVCECVDCNRPQCGWGLCRLHRARMLQPPCTAKHHTWTTAGRCLTCRVWKRAPAGVEVR